MQRATLVSALAALALAAGLWWTRTPPVPCRCAAGAGHEAAPRAPIEKTASAAELQRLRGRIAALESRAAGASPTALADGPSAQAAADSPARGEDPRAFVDHRDPHPSVSVTLSDGDAMSVRNVDPALTGQVMFVELRTADGRVVRRPVTVPPPE